MRHLTNMEPWKKPRPAAKERTKLTPDEIERARERARKAGRRYPNLVDNMWVVRQRTRAGGSQGRVVRRQGGRRP